MVMKVLRVMRGVLGTAIAWGLAWIPFTLGAWGALAVFGGEVAPLRYLGAAVVGAALRGAISGAAFAGVLAIAGRRRTFATLRARDMLLWGAIGGVVAPAIVFTAIALTSKVAIPLTAFGFGLGMASLSGAVCAVATLGIARRAPEIAVHHPALLEGGAETA
jgi:hypothetical protein